MEIKMNIDKLYLVTEALKCYKEGIEEERLALLRDGTVEEKQQSLYDLGLVNEMIKEFELEMEDGDEEFEFVYAEPTKVKIVGAA